MDTPITHYDETVFKQSLSMRFSLTSTPGTQAVVTLSQVPIYGSVTK